MTSGPVTGARRYYTTDQVARMAGCDARTVIRAIEAGRLPGRKERVGALQQPPCRRGAKPREVWAVDPADARAWAAAYTPWGRPA